jgi:hypothetical protein
MGDVEMHGLDEMPFGDVEANEQEALLTTEEAEHDATPLLSLNIGSGEQPEAKETENDQFERIAMTRGRLGMRDVAPVETHDDIDDNWPVQRVRAEEEQEFNVGAFIGGCCCPLCGCIFACTDNRIGHSCCAGGVTGFVFNLIVVFVKTHMD